MNNINTRETRIEIAYKEQNIIYNTVKRTLDIILSLIGLILLSPVFLIIAAVIRLDSKGKVIFGHERIGQNMKKIKIYKFRTISNIWS